jgi:hypothetical protein
MKYSGRHLPRWLHGKAIGRRSILLFLYLKSGGSNGSHTTLGNFKYNVQVESDIVLVIEIREGFRNCSFPHVVAHNDSFWFSPLVSLDPHLVILTEV